MGVSSRKSRGISNIYINKILYRYDINFKGVYSSDTIPRKKLNNNESIIVNLSKIKQKGTHFIAIKIINNELYIADSLKLQYYNKYIMSYIKRYNIVHYAPFPIQSLYSIYCGFFAMSFVMYSNNKTFNQFYNLFFKRMLSKNDAISIKIISNCISKME